MTKQKTHCAVLIIAITLVLMTAFQMRQIINERGLISQQYNAQEQALAQAKKVAAQLESLAVGTARLAGEGNTAAKNIITGLANAGVTVNPNATEGQKSLEFRQPQAPGAATNTPTAPAAEPAPAAVGN